MKFLILTLVLVTFNSCAIKSPVINDRAFESEKCENITPENAPICDPDGDLANGDYDAA